MSRITGIVAVLGALLLGGCDSKPSTSSPPSGTSPSPAVTKSPDEPVPFDEPPPPPQSATAISDLEQVLKNAEPLPEPPLASPGNEHRPLLPDKSLLLELAPDPNNPGKKKPLRVLVATEICLRQGPLEVFMCRKGTKEHESIVRTAIDGRLIHAALIAAGGKPGSPVQFVDPKTQEEAYKPASGTTIDVKVHYRKEGQLHTHPAQDWIRDISTKKPMSHRWVFAGSRFIKNPDRPNDPDYYSANNGELISISNFMDSMLEVPVEVTRDDASLSFVAWTERLPTLLSKVWVILEPQPASAKASDNKSAR